MEYGEAPPRRFTEPLKFLPVAFMCGTILFLYLVYVFQHCLPRLQFGVDKEHVDTLIRDRGWWELVVFHALTFMLVISYVRAMFTSPGGIPADDKHWDYHQHDVSYVPSFLVETKKTGDRRHCKWCGKYKPDRTHHCRVCRSCVLRMDHHCPWIYNCVGYFNYKYFFLMLFYSMWDCQLIMWTMAETVNKTIEIETPFLTMFVVIFAQTIASFLGLLVTLFFLFHIWLIINAMTTIEFCEKTLPKKDAELKTGETSLYSQSSIYRNISAALGDNLLFWLLPIDGPSGDGLRYDRTDGSSPDDKMALVAYDDLEATRAVRKSKSACDPLQSLQCNSKNPTGDYDVRFS